MSNQIKARGVIDIDQETAKLLGCITIIEDEMTKLLFLNQKLESALVLAECKADAWRDVAENFHALAYAGVELSEGERGELDEVRATYDRLQREHKLDVALKAIYEKENRHRDQA